MYLRIKVSGKQVDNYIILKSEIKKSRQEEKGGGFWQVFLSGRKSIFKSFTIPLKHY